jgi:hypothetical protein
MIWYISYLQTLRKAVIQLGGKNCITFIKFGVPMELIMLIKMCLNEILNKVCIGKLLSDTYFKIVHKEMFCV